MLVPAVALLVAASPVAANSATVGGLLVDVGLAANALTLGAAPRWPKKECRRGKGQGAEI